MNKENKKNLKEEVLAKLEKEHIKMKPKWQFVLKGVLLMATSIIVLFLALYLFSFIIFLFQQSGFGFLPGYGLKGVSIIFVSFPWLLLIFLIISLVLLELILKRYALTYRRPLLYSLLIVIFFVLIMGFVIHRISLHRNIYDRVQQGRFPAVGRIYNKVGNIESEKMHPGLVSEMSEGGFFLEDPKGKILLVATSSNTQNEIIRKGDRVLVIGEIKDSSIQALGVHKMPNIRMRMK